MGAPRPAVERVSAPTTPPVEALDSVEVADDVNPVRADVRTQATGQVKMGRDEYYRYARAHSF